MAEAITAPCGIRRVVDHETAITEDLTLFRTSTILLLLATACGSSSAGKVAPTTAPPPAQDPLVEACEAGTARSCLAAASAAQTANRTHDAAELYSKACDLDEPTGCTFAGASFLEAPETLGRAASAFGRGCELGDATSCYGAGLVHSGVYGGTPDAAQAAQFFRKGCDAGLVDACGAFADALETGRGVPADADAARALRERACEQGDGSSCIALAASMRDADADAANALLEKACPMEGRACTQRGVVLLDEQRTGAAREWFGKACTGELPDLDGCGWLGWYMWTGTGGEMQKEEAVALLDAACSEGSALGCMFHASVVARSGDAARAETLLSRACELDAGQCDGMRKQFEKLANP